jgi:hypothetical protein
MKVLLPLISHVDIQVTTLRNRSVSKSVMAYFICFLILEILYLNVCQHPWIKVGRCHIDGHGMSDLFWSWWSDAELWEERAVAIVWRSASHYSVGRSYRHHNQAFFLPSARLWYPWLQDQGLYFSHRPPSHIDQFCLFSLFSYLAWNTSSPDHVNSYPSWCTAEIAYHCWLHFHELFLVLF